RVFDDAAVGDDDGGPAADGRPQLGAFHRNERHRVRRDQEGEQPDQAVDQGRARASHGNGRHVGQQNDGHQLVRLQGGHLAFAEDAQEKEHRRIENENADEDDDQLGGLPPTVWGRGRGIYARTAGARPPGRPGAGANGVAVLSSTAGSGGTPTRPKSTRTAIRAWPIWRWAGVSSLPDSGP